MKPSPKRVLRRRLVWIVCTLACLVGCERRALGPFECEALGARVIGITDARALADAQIKAALDTFTTECLTMPFDRAFARCVEQTGRTRSCLADLARRRPEIQGAQP